MVSRTKRPVKAKRAAARKSKKRPARRVRKPSPRVPRGTKITLEFDTKKRLPKTLSGWIVSAVRDAKRLGKKPGFKLDMRIYNEMMSEINGVETCHICLGGAAVVGLGLVPPGQDTNGVGTSSVAQALDHVRRGNLLDAVDELYGYNAFESLDDVLAQVALLGKPLSAAFEKSGERYRAPWPAYLKAARGLKALGL